MFADHVQRVAGDFDFQIVLADASLAAQARGRFQAPGFAELVFFVVARGAQRIEAGAYDDVAGGAHAGFFTSVFDVDAVLREGVAQQDAGAGVERDAFGAEVFVGQDGDAGHGGLRLRQM